MDLNDNHSSPWQEADAAEASGGGNSLLKKIAIGAGAFLFVALVAYGYYLFTKPATPNVRIEFSNIPGVLVAQVFPVTVSYSNYSDTTLKNATLIVSLSDETVFAGKGPEERVQEFLVGDVGPGSLGQQTINLLTTGGTQSLKHLEARLTYKLAQGSSAAFENKGTTDFSVGDTALAFGIDAPATVVAGEQFQVHLSYQNRLSADLQHIRIQADYPASFQFANATPTPSAFTNEWDVADIPQNATGTIVLSGTATGADSALNMNIRASVEIEGRTYQFLSQAATLAVKPSSLLVSVRVNDATDYIAKPGDTLRYVIQFKNNADVALNNIAVSANLVGEAFDFSSMITPAAFNSINNTLTWTVANTPTLASIGPGETQSVGFQVRVRQTIPIRRLSDKNYSLKARIQVNSPTVPSGFAGAKTFSLASFETKIGGRVHINALGYFYDPDSGIVNTGPYPPRVNQPTRYTVHWRVSNEITDLDTVRVSAFVPGGVKFTGVVKSTITALPVFNALTNEVSWDVGSVIATKGIISAPIEAIFQLEVTPAINQANQYIPILGQTSIQAHDAFTGGTLTDVHDAITSALPDDTRISQGTDHSVKP